jgi:hypothetical protein
MSELDPGREQSKHNLAVEVLRSTGVLRLVAFGHSMLPTLFPGDMLTVKVEPLAEIQAGDVVLFARQGRFFIHRNLRNVRRGSGSLLVTRGDSMPYADEPVTADELLGKIVSVERGARPPMSVPPCSRSRRMAGLMMGYSGKLRSLALLWHERTLRAGLAQSEYVHGEASPK